MKIIAGRFSPARKPAGRKSCPWMNVPSAALYTTCFGVTSLSTGNSLGSGIIACALPSDGLPASKERINGVAGCCASLAKYASHFPLDAIMGYHSMLSPEVTACGAPPLADTSHRCRRSISPQLELKKIFLRSGLNDMYSYSHSPGVRSVASPPAAGTEYRCSQPSCSDGKTSRSSPAQFNTSC